MKRPRPGVFKFFWQWLKNPLRTAAVVPSSSELAAAMIAELPDGTRRVIELGGGTGAITRELLAAGIPASHLLVLELNEELHAHLHTRFPGVQVVLGDARSLPQMAHENGFLDEGPADAIVSGLGLLTMPPSLQREIVAAAFECLRTDGVFVQFTYGPSAPVADAVVRELDLKVHRGDFVLRNVPPATVYVYSRRKPAVSD
ncbi:MAG TPA: methyltransferase domain-containing protein [Lysobacter sp.]|jgi:phosphatidylethanolamine/phosphatidyl-N-methylethanolamine N-methyltransferase|nr:methyltransferase domain-containing protein [Lysobacter sp.]